MRLDVTPHVSDNGMVFMNVHPSVKAIAEIVEGTDQPSLSTREAVTTVAVQDGATLIIGGLVQRNRNKSYSETPYLARIPLIGLLFRQKNHTDTKNDLVFLLTPRILTPELMEAEMDRSERLREPIEPHAGEDADGEFVW
jgi:general secretion pathway protein D